MQARSIIEGQKCFESKECHGMRRSVFLSHGHGHSEMGSDKDQTRHRSPCTLQAAKSAHNSFESPKVIRKAYLGHEPADVLGAALLAAFLTRRVALLQWRQYMSYAFIFLIQNLRRRRSRTCRHRNDSRAHAQQACRPRKLGSRRP
jgi:hypothetical protein